MQAFHEKLNKLAQIKERTPEEIAKDDAENKNLMAKVFRTLFYDNTARNAEAIEAPPEELAEPAPVVTSKHI